LTVHQIDLTASKLEDTALSVKPGKKQTTANKEQDSDAVRDMQMMSQAIPLMTGLLS
jgi:hypothetical protein